MADIAPHNDTYIKPIMHEREVTALSCFLSSATSYFEYGMGGSTTIAAKLVKGPIYAIDSDKNWVEKVRRTVGQRAMGADFRTVDIGPTGAWGNPIGTDHVNKFASYSLSIQNIPTRDLDFVFVDGRFRVASFLTALLNVRNDAVVAIHDYTARPEYHLVEEFARPISNCQQLVFFVKRSNFDLRKATAIRDAYITNPT